MNDAEFDDFLRTARGNVSLLGSFRRDVWKRIESAEITRPVGWVERVLVAVLKPAYATATIASMIALGLWAGSAGGLSHSDAREAYAQSVSPFLAAHER